MRFFHKKTISEKVMDQVRKPEVVMSGIALITALYNHSAIENLKEELCGFKNRVFGKEESKETPEVTATTVTA